MADILLKKGTLVRIAHSTLEGIVVRPAIVDDDVHYFVNYLDKDGVEQERHFARDEIEVMEEKGKTDAQDGEEVQQ